MAFPDPSIVTDPCSLGDTPEDLAARYKGRKMTPQMLAALKQEAASLGIEHVFVQIQYVHLGKLSAAAFKEVVGRAPEQDDLLRVNCLDAGKVGHYKCGWCESHGSPRFQCGCLARTG